MTKGKAPRMSPQQNMATIASLPISARAAWAKVRCAYQHQNGDEMSHLQPYLPLETFRLRFDQEWSAPAIPNAWFV